MSADPLVVYPGNLQGNSMKPSERHPKGAVLVQCVDGLLKEPEFVALDVMRFCDEELEVSGTVKFADLLAAIEDRGSHLDEDNDGRFVVVRLALTGASDVSDELTTARMDELLQEAREAAPPNVWWDRIRDTTTATIDLAKLREANDFQGTALREVEKTSHEVEQLVEDLPNTVKEQLDFALRHDADLESELANIADTNHADRAEQILAELFNGGL